MRAVKTSADTPTTIPTEVLDLIQPPADLRRQANPDAERERKHLTIIPREADCYPLHSHRKAMESCLERLSNGVDFARPGRGKQLKELVIEEVCNGQEEGNCTEASAAGC